MSGIREDFFEVMAKLKGARLNESVDPLDGIRLPNLDRAWQKGQPPNPNTAGTAKDSPTGETGTEVFWSRHRRCSHSCCYGFQLEAKALVPRKAP